MKSYKRVASAALSVIALLGFASCNSGGSRNTENTGSVATTTPVSTGDSNKELENEIDYQGMADIGTVDTANEEGTGPAYVSGQTAGLVKALCYYDIIPSEPEIAEIFAERYGGTMETNICGSMEYFERLGLLIAAGDSPDLVRYDWAAFPDSVARNRYTALDEWLDIESPLWADLTDVIESFEYAGKHYYFPQNVQPNFAIIYNRALIEEAGMKDPFELYKEGNWTWDTFSELLVQWSQKGDEYTPFTGGSWSSLQFINTTGTQIIDVTDTEILNNLRNENVSRTMDWLEGLRKQGLLGKGYIHPGEAFTDGHLLFLGMGFTWGLESSQECLFKNQIEGEMFAVPFPRDPKSDKYYISSDTYGYMVPTGAKNVQGGVQWILSSRIYETDPDVVEEVRAEMMYDGPVYYPKCPGCKYNFTENNQDDLDTCPECNTARKQKFKPVYSEDQMQVYYDMIDPDKFGMVYDCAMGFNTDFTNIFVNSETAMLDGALYGEVSFTVAVEEQYGVVEAYLDTYRAMLNDANAAAASAS